MQKNAKTAKKELALLCENLKCKSINLLLSKGDRRDKITFTLLGFYNNVSRVLFEWHFDVWNLNL